MNFINPQLLMENALKNKQFKKIDDIYPPTEKDFDDSLNYYNDINNYNKQMSGMNQHVKGKQEMKQINQNELNQMEQLQNQQTGEIKTKLPETFYIPQNYISPKHETFDFPDVFKLHNNKYQNLNIPSIPLTKIIIVILILIIVYLYVKIEVLKTKLECKFINVEYKQK